MAVKDIVESAINDNKVMLFVKSTCPFCAKSRALLDSMGVKYATIEVDLREDGDEIKQYLLEKTGQKSVPNIFINKQHVGGNDDLHAAQASGKLQKLLEQ